MLKTIEERIAIVDDLLGRGGLILTDPLMPNSLSNKDICGACTGYQFRLNNLSYRGVWISTIEDLTLTVDNQPVPKCDMSLKIGNFSCSIDELKNNSDVFWCCEDECYIIVNKVGGLSKGEHLFELTLAKRQDFGHSYGEGEDNEGYLRDATELQKPKVIRDRIVYKI